MALNIRSFEAEELPSELARRTGETKTEALTKALRHRLARVRAEHGGRKRRDEMLRIDTSALVAILIGEPEQIAFIDAII